MKWNPQPERSLVSNLKSKSGEFVTLMGRVLSVRSHGEISFFDLVDRSGQIQCVVADGMEPPRSQSIVCIQGAVVEAAAADCEVELRVTETKVLDEPIDALPFDPGAIPAPGGDGGPGIGTLFDSRQISLRNQRHLAIVRFTSHLLAAVDRFFAANDFVEIKTPKIVAGSTEGGAGLFEIKYFERAAYLAQSPQLYKQTLASTPLERVFEIGSVFRAEKHETGRHLNEFTGIDVEVAYPGDLSNLMDLIEVFLREADREAKDRARLELESLDVSLPELGRPFPRLSLDEAITIATGHEPSRAQPADGLSPDQERAVCDWAAKEHGSDAVLVHGYPAFARPFYTEPGANPRLSASFDLLLCGLEISSGGLRIHRADRLEESIRRHGLSLERMSGYLGVFRTGCPPHGGFGIGLERFVQMLLGLPNVRYACLFPRDRNRISP